MPLNLWSTTTESRMTALIRCANSLRLRTKSTTINFLLRTSSARRKQLGSWRRYWMTSLNQSASRADLAAGLDRALSLMGLSLSALLARADEVVLFGSRVCDLAAADSDWDVLVVGEVEPIHRDGIDLVVVS